MLELSTYEDKSLMSCVKEPIVFKNLHLVLGWVVKEMENRYKLMTKVGVKNIDGYNSKHKTFMPYIVVIVDRNVRFNVSLWKRYRKLYSKTISNGKGSRNSYYHGNSKA